MPTTILSERDALYAAILDKPEDDAPRLIFADWLEEHGEEERAEFIRVQIELGKEPSECDHMFCDGSLIVCDNCRHWKTLHKKKFQLLDANRKWFRTEGFSDNVGFGQNQELVFWLAGDSRGNTQLIEANTARGFVDAVHLTLDQFLQHGRSIAKRHPIGRKGWVLTDCKPLFVSPKFLLVSVDDGIKLSYYAGHGIPNRIFKFLQQGSHLVEIYQGFHRYYEGDLFALDDISQALYTYARMEN